MRNLKQSGKAETLVLYHEAKALETSGYSWYKIAGILQLNESTVYRWIKGERNPQKWGKPGRCGKMVPCCVCGDLIWRDARKLSQKHFYCPLHKTNTPDTSVLLTPGLIAFLDGLLLGDGCIKRVSKVSGLYEQACASRREEWILILKQRFEEFGIKCGITTERRKGRDYSILKTSAYPILLDMRRRWYADGRKYIPEGVEISPELLANWYLGDGHLTVRNGVYLYSLAFAWASLERLVEKMTQALSILVKIHPRREHNVEFYYIHIPIDYSQLFLDYIEDYFVSCFSYKFDLIRSPLRRWSLNEVDLLKQQYSHRKAKEISEELGRPLRAVYIKAFKLGLKRYAS